MNLGLIGLSVANLWLRSRRDRPSGALADAPELALPGDAWVAKMLEAPVSRP